MLIIAIMILLFTIAMIIKWELNNSKSTLREKNIFVLFWGIPILFTIIIISYQIWVLASKAKDWGGMYLIGGAFIFTLTFRFAFYLKKIPIT